MPSRGADVGIAFLPAQAKWLLCVIWGWLKCSCSLKHFLSLFLVDTTLLLSALGWLLAPGRLGFHTEVLQYMSHFHIVAEAQLGELPPTQAGAGASHEEEGWSCVLLSHPGAGAACPVGAGGLAPASALVSAVWLGNAGLVMVQCLMPDFCALCSGGVPVLLALLLDRCVRGWIEGLEVLLVLTGGQSGAACALLPTVYPESQPLCCL